jgi:hypothetical protein
LKFALEFQLPSNFSCSCSVEIVQRPKKSVEQNDFWSSLDIDLIKLAIGAGKRAKWIKGKMNFWWIWGSG